MLVTSPFLSYHFILVKKTLDWYDILFLCYLAMDCIEKMGVLLVKEWKKAIPRDVTKR
jgi:hypothetical protein